MYLILTENKDQELYGPPRMCTACGETKPRDSHYYVNTSLVDGYTKKCKVCLREYQRNYQRNKRALPPSTGALAKKKKASRTKCKRLLWGHMANKK